MDHHGFLNTIRVLSTTLRDVQYKRQNSLEWNWAGTPLMFPETICPFCHGVARSPYIWLIEEKPKPRLIGVVKTTSEGKIGIAYANHPHCTGGGYLCLGNHANVYNLFASAPNLDDCPFGTRRIPMWLRTYWDHRCDEAVEYLRSKADFQEYLTEYLR